MQKLSSPNANGAAFVKGIPPAPATSFYVKLVVMPTTNSVLTVRSFLNDRPKEDRPARLQKTKDSERLFDGNLNYRNIVKSPSNGDYRL